MQKLEKTPLRDPPAGRWVPSSYEGPEAPNKSPEYRDGTPTTVRQPLPYTLNQLQGSLLQTVRPGLSHGKKHRSPSGLRVWLFANPVGAGGPASSRHRDERETVNGEGGGGGEPEKGLAGNITLGHWQQI